MILFRIRSAPTPRCIYGSISTCLKSNLGYLCRTQMFGNVKTSGTTISKFISQDYRLLPTVAALTSVSTALEISLPLS